MEEKTKKILQRIIIYSVLSTTILSSSIILAIRSRNQKYSLILEQLNEVKLSALECSISSNDLEKIRRCGEIYFDFQTVLSYLSGDKKGFDDNLEEQLRRYNYPNQNINFNNTYIRCHK